MSTEVGTKSPTHVKKNVEISDNAPLAGLPGQCALELASDLYLM